MRITRPSNNLRAAAVVSAMALSFPLCGCGNLLAPSGGFDAKSYEGVYSGTWENEAAGASGDARIEVVIDEEAGTATLILDFDGNYLGLGDPPAHEMTGNFDANGAQLHGESTMFGTYDVLVAADGAMLGVFRNVGMGAVPLLTYTGQLDADRLTAEYNVVTADGQNFASTTELTKE